MDDYTPTGTVFLFDEIERLRREASGEALHVRPCPPQSSISTEGILSGRSTLDMTLREIGHASSANAKYEQARVRWEQEVAPKRREAFAPLRRNLADGRRIGEFWFHAFDGLRETISPQWWDSNSAELVTKGKAVSVNRSIGGRGHQMEALILLRLETKEGNTPVPSKEARSEVGSEPGPIDQLIEFMREKGRYASFHGRPRAGWKKEAKSAGLIFASRDFDCAFNISVERKYIVKLVGAPYRAKQSIR